VYSKSRPERCRFPPQLVFGDMTLSEALRSVELFGGA
jgi:hypothetical protein